MTPNESLDSALAWLRDWEAKSLGNPRQHGNGFYQLDLSDGEHDYRLHVWDPEAPQAQTQPTPIHNHRFSFLSLVLYGVQHHVTYSVEVLERGRSVYKPTHHLYRVYDRNQEDTELVDANANVVARQLEHQTIQRGDAYSFRFGDWHETPVSELTVTLLEKTEVVQAWHPCVLIPWGVDPDNAFTRYDMSEDFVMDAIRRAMGKVLS